MVTNFWEHLFAGKTAVQSGHAEATQASTVIEIADKVPGLKHFVWSTLPGNVEGVSNSTTAIFAKMQRSDSIASDSHILSNYPYSGNPISNLSKQAKRTVVQHFDFKAKVDLKIKKEFPNLAAKTTFLYVGYYANNLANFPAVKLFTAPATFGLHAWMMPVSRGTVLPSAGDVGINVGVFTKAILEQPEKTLGKYAAVVADTPTHDEVLKYWMAATGKTAVFLQVDSNDWCKAFGEAAEELYLNLKAFEENDRWAFDNDPLSGKDLGIEKDLVGTKACLEKLKDQLL